MCRFMYVISAAACVSGLLLGCGDSGETAADRIGVGAQCDEAAECESTDENITLECLTQLTGGSCGHEGCEGDAVSPEGSACVTNDNGTNYCYRLCKEKLDCNQNRSLENEANCVGSGTINFVEDDTNRKACEPPSGA